MRILITWGSPHGGTEGIARILGEALDAAGFDVTLRSAEQGRGIDGFDAVLVGGALYAGRWPANVRRFVRRNVAALRRVPVYFFSSGPLDDSASRSDIAPTTQVAVLMERVGARAHHTFGGRLDPNAKSFPAREMAKTMAGDWRDPAHIRAWAADLAVELPEAKPGVAVDHPARSLRRLLGYAVVGWALHAALLLGLQSVAPRGVALVAHSVLVTLAFVALSWRYFHARGARDPLPTALTFVGVVAALDALVLAGVVYRSADIFASVATTWLPFALLFAATAATGGVVSTLPWPKPEERHHGDDAHAHP
ncbi:MAG: hypothetical protein KF901_05485 [Myxococcales bacterium]|nr:hypothetical protein [Myxococcales bacterium]